MVTVVERKRGNQVFKYLYHDRTTGKRKQFDKYLGKKIPEDIEEKKKEFLLEIERDEWIPQLKKIAKNFQKEQKKIPIEIKEKNLKSFSVKFTYNTQRIEGSTLTLKDTALLLEDGITPSNKPNKDVIETEIHYKVFVEAMNSSKEMTLKLVLKWHKELFSKTEPGIAGKLRNYDVVIVRSKFKPPPWEEALIMLPKFFQWNKQNSKILHPVELAALVHLKIVTIHPFGNGNGRTSRLMMNYVLNMFDYPLLNIGYSDRRSYYNALERSQTKKNEIYFLQWFMKRYLKIYKKYLIKKI